MSIMQSSSGTQSGGWEVDCTGMYRNGGGGGIGGGGIPVGGGGGGGHVVMVNIIFIVRDTKFCSSSCSPVIDLCR